MCALHVDNTQLTSRSWNLRRLGPRCSTWAQPAVYPAWSTAAMLLQM